MVVMVKMVMVIMMAFWFAMMTMMMIPGTAEARCHALASSGLR